MTAFGYECDYADEHREGPWIVVEAGDERGHRINLTPDGARRLAVALLEIAESIEGVSA